MYHLNGNYPRHIKYCSCYGKVVVYNTFPRLNKKTVSAHGNKRSPDEDQDDMYIYLFDKERRPVTSIMETSFSSQHFPINDMK